MTPISPTVQSSAAKVATQAQCQVSALPQKQFTRSNTTTVDRSSFEGRLYDAGFRGVMRYLEASKFSDTVLRIPFRAVSEFLRHSTGASLDLIVNKEKITKKVLFPAIRRSLENAVGTTIIDPNTLGSGKVVRMTAGFANMVIRLATRVLLAALDIVEPGELDMESLGDELVGRTLPRAICSSTMNPIIGIGVRVVEQLGINELTHLSPIQKVKRLVSNKISKTTQTV